MGYREIELKLPTGYDESDLTAAIARRVKTRDFTWRIELKSLDARDKRRIVWLLKIGVVSKGIQGGAAAAVEPVLEIPRRRRDARVLVVGSGPAGFFAALVLRRAGFDVTLIERGLEVEERAARIEAFETTGLFDPQGNYAFGEGGAGTFSDGKLTSRSKHIGPERRYILNTYAEAGGPAEILYLAHPHLGSDNLRRITANLRNRFRNEGGRLLFGTMLTGLIIAAGRVVGAETGAGRIDADHFVIAPGHSAFETHRMLMARGVIYEPKNFAVGCRVEHPQALINRAQWGVESLSGVKAAEYRLTSRGDGTRPVYTFCMCPGGTVVPAAAYADTNIVNGMSLYARDGRFANAACVAGVTPEGLWGADASAPLALDWLEDLERTFRSHTGDFRAPACTIAEFLGGHSPTAGLPETSYPLGLCPSPLRELLPSAVVSALRTGLEEFCRTLPGFEDGLMLGLESKTSSAVRAVRDDSGRCAGFGNLWIAGEGAGYSGGIVSSAADGIRTAMRIASI